MKPIGNEEIKQVQDYIKSIFWLKNAERCEDNIVSDLRNYCVKKAYEKATSWRMRGYITEVAKKMAINDMKVMNKTKKHDRIIQWDQTKELLDMRKRYLKDSEVLIYKKPKPMKVLQRAYSFA